MSDLHLMSLLGRGGYGHVFRGKWRGMLAAIKVRPVPCLKKRRGMLPFIKVKPASCFGNASRAYLISPKLFSTGLTMRYDL